MAYIIAEPCIGTKDTACVDVCPVDCIHPAKGRTYDDGRPTYDEVPQLYIDPSECIDCGACCAGLPGDGHLRAGRPAGEVAGIYRDQQELRRRRQISARQVSKI